MTLPPTAYLPVEGPNKVFGQNLKFEEEFEKERAEGFKKRIRKELLSVGVPPRLHDSVKAQIPPEIARLKHFQAFPSKGFGLLGPHGCGKSCALVVAIKQIMLKEFVEAGPTVIEDIKPDPGKIGQPFQGQHRIDPELQTRFRWVGWPAYARRMKGHAARREWDHPDASVTQLITWITSYPEERILILDDIGEENIKPDSYTTEELEHLVDELYNHECRLFWTSNHTPEQMDRPEYYGSRLLSRLIGLSPDATLPSDMPDLRVKALE